MQVLLFSDLHLDRPFEWASVPVARKRRQNLRDALARIIQLAMDEHVDAMLCGGDLYEHDRVAPDTGAFLREMFGRLDPMPVFLAPGNHDWLGSQSLYRTVRWSPNVHVFTGTGLEPLPLAEGMTLWGAAHHAPVGTPNLVQAFRVDRPGVHVALFHGSEMGWLARQGDGKAPHAPFHADEIAQAGLHHALLGHYHAPQDGDLVTYPGNPDPLSFGETGDRGAVIVTLDADGRVTRDHRSVAVSLTHDVRIDLTGCTTRQAIRERGRAAVAGLRGAARLTVYGELPPEVDFEEADLAGIDDSLDAVVVRVESLRVGYDLDAIGREATVRGQFVRDVRESSLPDDDRRRVIITGLRALEDRDDLEVD